MSSNVAGFREALARVVGLIAAPTATRIPSERVGFSDWVCSGGVDVGDRLRRPSTAMLLAILYALVRLLLELLLVRSRRDLASEVESSSCARRSGSSVARPGGFATTPVTACSSPR